jgi:hypothetical protein
VRAVRLEITVDIRASAAPAPVEPGGAVFTGFVPHSANLSIKVLALRGCEFFDLANFVSNLKPPVIDGIEIGE